MPITVTNNDANVNPPAEKPAETTEEKLSASTQEVDETADESETSGATDGVEGIEAKDGDDSDDESDETELKPEQRPKKNGFKKRIDKLTSKLSLKDQEIEHWRNEALKNSRNQDAKPQSAKPIEEGRPKAERFETHEEYVEALADWKVDQKLKAKEIQDREAQVKNEQRTRVQTLQTKIKEFSAKHDDFQELVDAVETPMSVAVEEFFLMDADNAPALMYALAKNPDEYERINKLPPLAAARELGRLEAGLKTQVAPKKTEKKKTKAPEPVTPIRGATAGSAKTLESAAKAGAAEYQRMRMEQIKNRGSSWG